MARQQLHTRLRQLEAHQGARPVLFAWCDEVDPSPEVQEETRLAALQRHGYAPWAVVRVVVLCWGRAPEPAETLDLWGVDDAAHSDPRGG